MEPFRQFGDRHHLVAVAQSETLTQHRECSRANVVHRGAVTLRQAFPVGAEHQRHVRIGRCGQTQQLLQQQYDYGLKLSGIGDNIALGAIKTGMQANQQVNQANQQFYQALAQMAAPFLMGQAPVYQVSGTK